MFNLKYVHCLKARFSYICIQCGMGKIKIRIILSFVLKRSICGALKVYSLILQKSTAVSRGRGADTLPRRAGSCEGGTRQPLGGHRGEGASLPGGGEGTVQRRDDSSGGEGEEEGGRFGRDEGMHAHRGPELREQPQCSSSIAGGCRCSGNGRGEAGQGQVVKGLGCHSSSRCEIFQGTEFTPTRESGFGSRWDTEASPSPYNSSFEPCARRFLITEDE